MGHRPSSRFRPTWTCWQSIFSYRYKMPRKRTRDDRKLLAEKRLRSILRSHVIAPMRTLEQKISDAGPFGQRINPHALNEALGGLVSRGNIVREKISNTPWYYLASTPVDIVRERRDELHPIYVRTQDSGFTQRVGQTLEIAVLRSLRELHVSNQKVCRFRRGGDEAVGDLSCCTIDKIHYR